MRLLILATAAAALAVPALAEDNQAGVPLAASEAAGAWTVSSGGQDLCVLSFTAQHAVRAPATCADALPTRPTAWKATRDGVRLLGADGAPLIAFNRWSNSLFVSHRASGADIQLRRGGPEG